MNKGISIAIDGTSASGKGTVARMIAEYYNLPYLDTGKMYRSFARYLIVNSIDINDTEKIKQFVNSFNFNPDEKKYTSEDIAHVASIISVIKEVREKLTNLQRDFAKNGAVLDGRDIGSVVLQDANYKFFITADIETRSQRRMQELKNNNIECDIDIVRKQLTQRDELDSNRSNSPLVIPKDAFIIDTSNLSPNEILEIMIKKIESKKEVL